jgi:FeS assembly SUF system protein
MSEIDRDALAKRVIEVLRTIYDPEIPVNIYDLGLVYDIEVALDGVVRVRMTLTSPACPVAGALPEYVHSNIQAIEDVRDAEVEIVWDPPWSPERMSDEARVQLNL